MRIYLVRIILIAAYIWSGTAWDSNTNVPERRALSTILVDVTPTQTTPNPTSNIVIPPVQIAKPVSQPACRVQANLGPIPQNLSMTDGQVSPNRLLYRMRQMVCNGTCSVPQGAPSSDVVIAQNGYCEISIGVTESLEAWVFSNFPPVGVEQQECWDSTKNIIDQCIRNQANDGWWNGYVICNHSSLHSHTKPAKDSGLTLK